MESEKMLQAISEMIDTKLAENLQPVNNRLDKIESRLDVIEIIQKRTTKKLEDLQLDVKIAEREIRRDIHDLNDEMETVIEVLKMNEMLPR